MRTPSTTADFKSSLRRLRTTPARNPRTECDCQPVAFVSAAMVAPPGARSMFIAADCFVPDRTAKTRLPLCPAFLSLGWLLDGAADRAAVRLFALLIIGISSVQLQHACCTTEAPQKLLRRRGEIPELQKRAGS